MVWKRLSLCDLHKLTVDGFERSNQLDKRSTSTDKDVSISKEEVLKVPDRSYYFRLLDRCEAGELGETARIEIEKDIGR